MTFKLTHFNTVVKSFIFMLNLSMFVKVKNLSFFYLTEIWPTFRNCELLWLGSGQVRGEKLKMVQSRWKFQGICNFCHKFRIRTWIFRFIFIKPVKTEKPVILMVLSYCHEISQITTAWWIDFESQILFTVILSKYRKIPKKGVFFSKHACVRNEIFLKNASVQKGIFTKTLQFRIFFSRFSH